MYFCQVIYKNENIKILFKIDLNYYHFLINYNSIN